MATIVTGGGGGLLGGLGKLAGAAGVLTGNPWLGALGMGMGAADSLINGGSPQGAVGQVLSGLLYGGWQNPAAGNIASTKPYEATALDWAKMYQGGRR